MRPLMADSADRVLGGGEKSKGAAGRKAPVERELLRRQRHRKLGRFVIAGAFAVALAGGYVGLQRDWHGAALAAMDQGLDTAFRAAGLGVAEVTLEGRRRAGPEALRRALGVAVGDPILRLDLEDLQHRVEGVGWVETATVTRRLPDRLHIAIVEREPFARWQLDGRTALIDRTGQVILADVGARYLTLPRLVGPGANLRAAELFALLDSAPALKRQVSTASLIRERRWDIGMESGVTVRLPETDPGEAWARFSEVNRRDGLLEKRLNLIDLRVPGRVIVRLEPPAAEPGAVERET
jgi:cell division protein FtsQ